MLYCACIKVKSGVGLVNDLSSFDQGNDMACRMSVTCHGLFTCACVISVFLLLTILQRVTEVSAELAGIDKVAQQVAGVAALRDTSSTTGYVPPASRYDPVTRCVKPAA